MLGLNKTIGGLMLGAGLLLGGTAQAADNYPSKPVHILVPYAAGGAVDVLARTLGQALAKTWGQQPVIDNRPGAGGIVASQALTQAAPDGYTLILVASGHPLNQFIYPSVPYDTFKDFTAITEVASSPLAIVVAKDSPYKTLGDLLAAAKKEPDKLSYGMSGNGTSAHLAGELLKHMSGTRIVAIPYKGGAPALTAVIAGEIPLSINPLAEAIGQAMHVEYKQIVDNGLVAQLDDARAAVTYDRMVPPASFQDYRKRVRLYQDVLNRATEGIPTEKLRYHVCWGSWPGPHTTDVPIKDIMDLILRVRAGAYVLEMANPRHEHEWQVWRDVKLPKGSVLIPGVISHATNVVEHPELVKERIVRLAKLVGRENIIAGTDCGFAQQPFYQRVHPTIQWAKLQSLVEGARLASKELWGRGKKSAAKKSAAKKSAPKRKAVKAIKRRRAA